MTTPMCPLFRGSTAFPLSIEFLNRLSEEVRWSTEGLRAVEVTRDGNTVSVVCASTHLTSFAVLVDVRGAQVLCMSWSVVGSSPT